MLKPRGHLSFDSPRRAKQAGRRADFTLRVFLKGLNPNNIFHGPYFAKTLHDYWQTSLFIHIE